MWFLHLQVCGNGLLEGGCMTPERLAKHKDEQVMWFWMVANFKVCVCIWESELSKYEKNQSFSDCQESWESKELSWLLGLLKVSPRQVMDTHWQLLPEFWSKYWPLIGALQMIEEYFSGRTCRILGWFLRTRKIHPAQTVLVQGS